MQDTSKLTTDELRALALNPPEDQDQLQQPRGKDGRFAATEPADENEEEQVEEVDEIVYERTIDLGDGSGVQVFRGKTPEELIDKLADAQANATRKIREQAAALKTQPKPAEEEDDKPLTADERYVLSQQMLTEPEKVIAKYVAKETAKLRKKVEELESGDQQTKREKRENANSVEFVQKNPDYYVCEANGLKMVKWMEIHGVEATPENLQAAYEDLNTSGLLVERPAEEQDNAGNTEEVTERRIVQPKPETVVTRRKVVGGSVTSKRQAASAAQRTSEPTAEELAKMSTEQLRQNALNYVLGR